jgi:hypothetical protein
MMKVACASPDIEVFVDYRSGRGPVRIAFVARGDDPQEDDWVLFSSRDSRALIRTLDGARKGAYGTEALVRVGGDSAGESEMKGGA